MATSVSRHSLGRVQVTTTDGRVFDGAIDEPKGDPGNTLTRSELEEKFSRLAAFSSALNPSQTKLLIERLWRSTATLIWSR